MKFNISGKPEPKEFWAIYTKDMNPLDCLMYLYVLDCGNEERISIKTVAYKFSVDEDRVCEAFLLWEEKGLAKYDKDKDEIRLLCEKPFEIDKTVKWLCSEGRSPFIDTCTMHLGRQLSVTELKLFNDMRDWIGLEEEVIYTLIDYCVTKEKDRARYMEAVAMDWKKKGIASREAAVEYIHTQENEFSDILNALGKRGYSPTKTDERYFIRWIKELNMPMEIILEACSRTVESLGKANLKYTDRILENWKAKGVRIKEDIEHLDREFREKKETDAIRSNERVSNKREWKNRFVNFPQREWDFEEMERSESQRHDRNP